MTISLLSTRYHTYKTCTMYLDSAKANQAGEMDGPMSRSARTILALLTCHVLRKPLKNLVFGANVIAALVLNRHDLLFSCPSVYIR